MTKSDNPKKIEKQLRELAHQAYENELYSRLKQLAREFTRWESGELDCWDLKERIHKFQQDISQEMFRRYSHKDKGFLVAQALLNGYLNDRIVSAEIQKHIQQHLEVFTDSTVGEDENGE